MSDPYLGEIRMVGFNFAPEGWAFCDGSQLPINQYDALFSLIGITYGGDGVTSFALPDLRSRVPIHMGQGANLTPRVTGAKVGSETAQVAINQLPSHTHPVQCDSANGPNSGPVGGVWAQAPNAKNYATPTAGSGTMNAGTITCTGGGLAHDNMIPFQVVGFIIALEGIYPVRP